MYRHIFSDIYQGYWGQLCKLFTVQAPPPHLRSQIVAHQSLPFGLGLPTKRGHCFVICTEPTPVLTQCLLA